MRTASAKSPTYKRTSDHALEQYFERVSRQPMMTPEEERRVACDWRASGKLPLKERLVNANLRFVAKVAFEYENYGFPILDLIQEGNVGLVRAVDSYDPEKGYRLISYAVWWIRACIHDYILKNWSLVKLGTTQKQRAMFNRLVSSRKRVERLAGSDAPAYRQEIADSVGATAGEVHEFEMRMRTRPVHLEESAGGEGQRTLSYHEVLADEEGDVEELVGEEQLEHFRRRALSEALECLPDRERHIVVERHLSPRKATFRQLGDEMGVSKERIRQLESRALKTLRTALSGSQMVQELLAA